MFGEMGISLSFGQWEEMVLQVHQICVPSFFDDPSIFEDQDVVAFLDSAQPVGDWYGGLILESWLEVIEHDFLGICVQGTGELIEQVERWVADQASTEGDSLLLATWHLHSFLSNLLLKT